MADARAIKSSSRFSRPQTRFYDEGQPSHKLQMHLALIKYYEYTESSKTNRVRNRRKFARKNMVHASNARGIWTIKLAQCSTKRPYQVPHIQLSTSTIICLYERRTVIFFIEIEASISPKFKKVFTLRGSKLKDRFPCHRTTRIEWTDAGEEKLTGRRNSGIWKRDRDIAKGQKMEAKFWRCRVSHFSARKSLERDCASIFSVRSLSWLV